MRTPPGGVSGFVKVGDWFFGQTPSPPGGGPPQSEKNPRLFFTFLHGKHLEVFQKLVSGFSKVESGHPRGGSSKEVWCGRVRCGGWGTKRAMTRAVGELCGDWGCQQVGGLGALSHLVSGRYPYCIWFFSCPLSPRHLGPTRES